MPSSSRRARRSPSSTSSSTSSSLSSSDSDTVDRKLSARPKPRTGHAVSRSSNSKRSRLSTASGSTTSRSKQLAQLPRHRLVAIAEYACRHGEIEIDDDEEEAGETAEDRERRQMERQRDELCKRIGETFEAFEEEAKVDVSRALDKIEGAAHESFKPFTGEGTKLQLEIIHRTQTNMVQTMWDTYTDVLAVLQAEDANMNEILKEYTDGAAARKRVVDKLKIDMAAAQERHRAELQGILDELAASEKDRVREIKATSKSTSKGRRSRK